MSKEIKNSPNSVDGGENPDKENKSKKKLKILVSKDKKIDKEM